MKFIQKMYFNGESVKAIEKYKQAFGCTVRTLLFYSDAVKQGWEQPNPVIDSTLYHCEIMFGDQEVRFNDTDDAEILETARKLEYVLQFDTEAEVVMAFDILKEGGEVISPLEKPPYMVIIGTVRDCFGIKWTLMCDFK